MLSLHVRPGGEPGLQDAGASGSSVGDLRGLGALLPGRVGGSAQGHGQTDVRTGQHLHGTGAKGSHAAHVVKPRSCSSNVKFLSLNRKQRSNDCRGPRRVSAFLRS